MKKNYSVKKRRNKFGQNSCFDKSKNSIFHKDISYIVNE